jgi:glycine cleavage system regulatory protein
MVPTQTGQDHALVIRVLRAQSRPEAYQLRRLRFQRVQADYDLNISISQAQAQRAVHVAQTVWNRL